MLGLYSGFALQAAGRSGFDGLRTGAPLPNGANSRLTERVDAIPVSGKKQGAVANDKTCPVEGRSFVFGLQNCGKL
jgi:hypothetical protein